MSEQIGFDSAKLDEYDNPVLYSPQSSIWHIPAIEDGRLRFLCGRSGQKMRIKELDSFRWKRGSRQCEFCEAEESEESGDRARVGGDSA